MKVLLYLCLGLLTFIGWYCSGGNEPYLTEEEFCIKVENDSTIKELFNETVVIGQYYKKIYCNIYRLDGQNHRFIYISEYKKDAYLKEYYIDDTLLLQEQYDSVWVNKSKRVVEKYRSFNRVGVKFGLNSFGIEKIEGPVNNRLWFKFTNSVIFEYDYETGKCSKDRYVDPKYRDKE